MVQKFVLCLFYALSPGVTYLLLWSVQRFKITASGCFFGAETLPIGSPEREDTQYGISIERRNSFLAQAVSIDVHDLLISLGSASDLELCEILP